MLMALIAVLTQGAVEPPRTINGIELGAAERFATPGPATVCMSEMVIALREGETAFLAYSGIHSGRIRLVRKDGRFAEFAVGDAWRDARRAGQGPVFRKASMRIYLTTDGQDIRYQLHDVPRTEWSDGSARPLISISGSALVGNAADDDLLQRISFDWDHTVTCDRSYNYGWSVIMGYDPIDAGPSETSGTDAIPAAENDTP